MKPYFLLFIIFICTIQIKAIPIFSKDTIAYDSTNTRKSKTVTTPFSYIGFTTGLNNPGGVIGFDFEIPVGKYVCINTGLGFSTWGNKLHAECKYYLKANQIGWAFGTGIALNSGVDNYQAKMETINGNQDIILDFHPVQSAFFCAYRHWNLGRKNSRFLCFFGGDVPIKHPVFRELSGDPLSSKSTDIIKRRAPGGFIVGLGFSFGLHH